MEAVSQEGILRGFTERRPRVMLEWDSAQNKVVAPRSQVGISWSPTSADSTKTSGSRSKARLVDGFDIPEELLELPDLNYILSAETWENCLTHSEREILSMDLPDGVDPESTVEALLSGGNFHFGNPLQRWGESVCSGTMHPDSILHRQLKVKEQQKSYSKRLRSYHGNMVRNLQKMKEVWEEWKTPEDFLMQIQRFGMSGWRTQGSHIKNVLLPYQKTIENGDLWGRHWNRCGEGVVLAREMSTRLKGGKIGQLEEGTKTLKVETSEIGTTRLKVKSPEGAKRLEIKPLEEGRKKGQSKSSQAETRRSKMKSAEGGINSLQMNPGVDAARRPEMKMSEDGVKRLKMKPSEDITRRLKFKPSMNGRKKLDVKPAEEWPKGLQTVLLDNEKDLATSAWTRTTAKRLVVKSSEGAKRLKSGHAEEGSQKSEIKLSEAGRKTQHNRSPEEERDPSSRANAKRPKVKSAEEQRMLRLKIPAEVSKSLKNSWEGPKLLKMEPLEERTKTLQIGAARGGKGLEFNPLEGSLRPKIPPPEEKDILSRPKEKGSKVKLQEQGTKQEKGKHKQQGQEERDLGNSDSEGEWFKKYVKVAVDPLSGSRLSKVIQSVKVTTKMFKDVKRRSEAGEEVHLDTLVPVEEPSSNRRTSKKATDPISNDCEIIASFWKTMLIKDLLAVHARFMQRKEQLHKLATSLASSCRNLWEIEVSNDAQASEGGPSQSGDYTSRSPGFASLGAEYASPSAGEHSFSGHGASPSGGEPFPSESEQSASGGETVPSGRDATRNVDESWPSGDEVLERGDEAVPSGDETMLSGDDASASEAVVEENCGIKS